MMETMNLFQQEFESIAIERIRKFAKIAKTIGLDVCLGFSGGKDSQVCYDLCKRAGVPFKAFFNRSFESPTTFKFIHEYYPDVIWRHDHNYGFIENIRNVHGGFLPTVEAAYCCKDYKHNPKYIDACSIVGVRKAESAKRAQRKTFEMRNKSLLKANKALVSEYFEEHCQSTGCQNLIQLKPIVDWSNEEVWQYIYRHNIPVNPEYQSSQRVGCIVCPKASFKQNVINLIKYPKLIDAFIRAREKGALDIDWVINREHDCVDDKVYYICRWLNHSFRPFTKKQEELYKQFREVYNSKKIT